MLRRLILLVSLLPYVAWGGLDLTPEEHAFLQANPVVYTNYTDDQPPLEFVSEGAPAGFIIEYLDSLADLAGFEINFGQKPELWENIDRDFSNWEIDLLTGTVTSERYSGHALLTDPYLHFQRVYVLRKSAPEFASPADLGTATIAATKGLAFVDVWKEKYPDLNFLMVDTTEEMILAVADGRADAAYTLKSTVDYFAARHALINLRSDSVPSAADEMENSFRIAVRSDWPELHSILNKAIKALPMETRNALWGKWLSFRTPMEELRFSVEELRFIQENPTLRYSILPDAPPIEFENAAGEPVGLTLDYLRIFEQKTGIRLQQVALETRAQKLVNLRSGQVNFLPTFSPYDVSDPTYLRTETYMEFPLVVATRIDVPYVENLSSFVGQRIGIVARIGQLEAYRARYPNAEFVACVSVLDGLQQLSQGALGAMIGPRPVIAYQIQELYLGNLKIAGVLDESLPLCALVRKEDAPLRSILDKVFRSVSSEQQSQMLNRWLSIRVEQGYDYSLIWKILAVVAVVILLILARVRIITRYNRKLETLNAELQQTLEERARIMSVISHDLRQPVHGYNRFLTLLQQGDVDPASDEGQRVLRQARHRGEQAIECMENLLASLNGSKQTQRTVKLSPQRLVEDCRELLIASMETKQISLNNRIDPDIRIVADEQRLAAVFRNLLNNAIKFSDHNSTIEVKSEKVMNGLRITISDHGIGMDATQLQNVSDGNTVECRRGTDGERGSGIGLGLCREFLRSIHADLQFESSPNQGTSVSFVLPH